jgi:hypothetical protein
MTHPAYLLARLNAANARLDTGSGGIQELTQQDIAASIAFVPQGIGRELLCRVWWPEGAKLNAADLDKRLIDLQFGEWRERMDALVTAQIHAQIAETGWARKQAQSELTRAQNRMWPRIDETYSLIRRAVVNELIDPRTCPDCKGRGAGVAGELVKGCMRCAGTGRTIRGPVWRAAQLRMKHQSYRQLWEQPYEWMFEKCNDEVHQATRELSKAASVS